MTRQFFGEVDPNVQVHLTVPVGNQDHSRIDPLLNLIADQQDSNEAFNTILYANYIDGVQPGFSLPEKPVLPPKTQLIVEGLPSHTDQGAPMNMGYIRRSMLENAPQSEDGKIVMLDADSLYISPGFVSELAQTLHEAGPDFITSPKMLWGSEKPVDPKIQSVLDYYAFLMDVSYLNVEKGFATDGAVAFWQQDYINAGGFHKDRRTSEMYELQYRMDAEFVYTPGAEVVSDSRRLLAAIAMGMPPSWAWERLSVDSAKDMLLPFDLDDEVRTEATQDKAHTEALAMVNDPVSLAEMITRMETQWLFAMDTEYNIPLKDALRFIHMGRLMCRLPASTLPNPERAA